MPLQRSGRRPVYVVDIDKGFRSLVAGALQRAGYGTREFETGDSALSAAADERPAAVLLDVHLPGLNGYEVCRQLRELHGDTLPILFVSGERTEGFDVAAGLLVGADDYLAKPVDAAELVARVRRLAKRLSPNDDGASQRGRLATLTQREHEVLDLLAEGYRQDEIASKLVISPKTVATHIQHILGKLEVRSRAQAVALALGRDVSGHIFA
jgi:DNA-binding NarL/FixJ family response regulator